MQTVHVVAIITAKTGMRDKVLEAFRANVPAVHAEAARSRRRSGLSIVILME